MADAADRAQDYQDRELAHALANRRQKAEYIAHCQNCGARNDRPAYTLCSDCVAPEAPA